MKYKTVLVQKRPPMKIKIEENKPKWYDRAMRALKDFLC